MIGFRKIVFLILIFTSIFIIPIGVNASSNYNVILNGKIVFTADNRRKIACNKMQYMSSVDWSLSKNRSYVYKIGNTAMLKRGKYRGIPYTQMNRIYSLPSKVQDNINDFSRRMSSIHGVDCSSAVSYALRYATSNNSSDDNYCMGSSSPYVSSSFLYDGMRSTGGTATNLAGRKILYRNNLHKVGNYGKYSNYNTALSSKTVLDNLANSDNYNSGNIYSNVYAKVKPGDVLVQYYDSSSVKGHVMIVQKVKIVYDGNSIDPNNSYIYVIDQISPNKSKYSNGRISSWRNDDTVSLKNGKKNNLFSFKYLARESYFVPVTAFSDTYDIAYDLDGGKGNITNQTKKSYTSINITKSIPEKDGYEFKDWVTTVNPSSKKYSSGSSYSEDFDEVFKAEWTPKTYSIAYSLNGGSGTNIPLHDVVFGSKVPAITNDIPSRDGYIFMGWYDNEDYTLGNEYYNDNSIPLRNYDKTSSTILYAGWKPNSQVSDTTYEISFDTNGGIGGQSTFVYVNYDKALPSLAPIVPSRDGYKFMGWYDERDYTLGKQYYFSSGIGARNYDKKSDMILYAGWSKNKNNHDNIEYKVSFNPNGGVGGQTESISVKHNLIMPDINTIPPVRENCIFMGWFDKANYKLGKQYYTRNGNAISNYDRQDDITLFAGWLGKNQIVVDTPAKVTALPVDYKTINLKWDSVKDAVGYVVYKYDFKNKKYKVVQLTNSNNINTTSGNITGVKSYYYVVSYKQVNGTKIYSNPSKVVVAVPKIKKTKLTKAVAYPNNSLYLKWKKVDGVSGYNIYKYSTNKKKYVLIKKTKSNSLLTKYGVKKKSSGSYRIISYRIVNNKILYSDYYGIVIKRS